MFVTGVNVVFGIMTYIAFAQRFGLGIGFTLGLFFLPIIFFPILTFGNY